MKRVLLVEDHAAFRESLAKVLEWQAGFETVSQAGSLGEGLARAGVLDGGLDVAVVNLGLPDGDGTDLISQMRSTEPDVPVLVLTLSQDPARHARALDAGAQRVLTKDASVDEIVDAVRRLGTGDPAVASGQRLPGPPPVQASRSASSTTERRSSRSTSSSSRRRLPT